MDKLVIDCASGEEVSEPLSPEDETQRAADALVAQTLEEQQTRAELVRQKIDDAIAQVHNELANWPADLPSNANSSTIVGRVNQVSAQLKRNTERIGKLAQLARGLYDVEE